MDYKKRMDYKKSGRPNKPEVNSMCYKTGKNGYLSERAARDAIKWNKKYHSSKASRSYLCPHCSQFHLTSQMQRTTFHSTPDNRSEF